jgi:hypothetical protein
LARELRHVAGELRVTFSRALLSDNESAVFYIEREPAFPLRRFVRSLRYAARLLSNACVNAFSPPVAHISW